MQGIVTRSTRLLAAALVAAATITTPSTAQTMEPDGCLRLSGSAACPAFSSAWINPRNLSNAFPFFNQVYDVATFDAGVFDYFASPYEYRQTKFVKQFGCSNASQAMLRYARTVLCSQWVNEHWSDICHQKYNGTYNQSRDGGPPMVGKQTCFEYAYSADIIVNNQTFCPGEDNTNGGRVSNLAQDFVDCTNWTSAYTASSDAVTGDENEGNCGWGTATGLLCDFCRNPVAGNSTYNCCYSSRTDLSSCNYVLIAPTTTASSSMTSSSSMASSSAAAASSSRAASQNRGLSGGQIAGIVVGSVVGGLLLLALLLALLACCGVISLGRKRQDNRQSGVSSFAADRPGSGAGAGAFASQPQMTQYAGGAGPSSGTLGPGTSSTYAGSTDKLSAGAAGLGLGMLAGRRAMLSRVRDENVSGDHMILPNSTVTVLWPYQASLPDELSLTPGDRLAVAQIFDDGWATGSIVEGADSGRTGAFPLVCVTSSSPSASSRRSPATVSQRFRGSASESVEGNSE